MDDALKSKRLLRMRPPRVRITYEVETAGAVEKKELPFIIGVLADLSGCNEKIVKAPLEERKFFDIDRDSFNDVMKTIHPRLDLNPVRATSAALQELLTQEEDLVIGFSSMGDFDPIQIVRALPSLNASYQSRTQMRTLQARIEMDDSFFDRLAALLATSDIGTAITTLVPSIRLTDIQTSAIRASVAESSDHLLAAIEAYVTHIDQQLSAAVSAIMHADSFKQLEAAWRGLQYLVLQTDTGVMLKLRVLDATKEELRIDLKTDVEFDQSALFKLVYEAEYGTDGGVPYSLLIGAYEITNEQADIDFLGKMSQIATSAHAPFIAAASCQLFDLPGFDKLDKPRLLNKIFDGMDLIGWNNFRTTEEARYVSLVLPRVLMRLPYGKPDKGSRIQCDGFDFEEVIDEQNSNDYLWGNAAFLLAQRVANAFSLYNWTAAIRGIDGGGSVDSLPIYSYKDQDNNTNLVGPIEIPIKESREQELNDLGFIPLCHRTDINKVAFFNSQSASLPKKYFSEDANTNARVSATLPYILATSRFAHYIKVIMREKIGSFLTRGNVESFLNSWISQYVLLDDPASADVNAAYPLRHAAVVVTENAESPGAYTATLFIQPHFMLPQTTSSTRLVISLPDREFKI